ncbi:hypothetical protein [Phycicoccus sp. Soil803]|uniref:hypothetical protein n=1 Tax=Phycicoccus sp. Soil803 TaxID=1736415 RepID=UPI0007098CCF|nr:hypothetical protein [Phycicoccus sp. Soil803]KRF23694.1 hypothetical protein ASG95_03165 [Phycicoccus sp. Soil803]
MAADGEAHGSRVGAGWWAPAAVLALTVVQLGVGTFASSLQQFEGKAFGARLVAYPVMMLVVPAAWWLAHRGRDVRVLWGAFALVMAPFLIDVTGNTLDLYDSVVWWDDANHFVNWALLCAGLGLLLLQGIRVRWARVLLVTGLGAVLAIGWELGEWYTFIRHGTELDTAYQDTLGDEALGTLGALVAGLALRRPRGADGG